MEAADQPGSDRARAFMAASGSAGFAGDPEAEKALGQRAESIDSDHPMVRLVAINEESDAATRLALLSELSPTDDAELDGLVEAVRTTALLDAGDFDAAEKAATTAAALAPWSAAVREALPAVVLARNRDRQRAGVATQRRELGAVRSARGMGEGSYTRACPADKGPRPGDSGHGRAGAQAGRRPQKVRRYSGGCSTTQMSTRTKWPRLSMNSPRSSFSSVALAKLMSWRSRLRRAATPRPDGWRRMRSLSAAG